MGASYERGMLFYHQARYSLALKAFREELSDSPGCAEAHVMLGMTMLYLKAAVGAEREIRAAIHLQPNMSYSYYALAQVALTPGNMRSTILAVDSQQDWLFRLQTARVMLNQAIRLDHQNPSYWGLLAWIAAQTWEWNLVLSASEKGLTFRPEDQQCLNLRAKALAGLGRRSEAAQTLTIAISRDPEDAATHLARGWFMLRRGLHRQAADHFTQSLRLNPSADGTRSALVQARLSRFFLYRWMLRLLLWRRGMREPAVPEMIVSIVFVPMALVTLTLTCWLQNSPHSIHARLCALAIVFAWPIAIGSFILCEQRRSRRPL